MPELERLLTQLGEELDWPATPDLTVGVLGRLGEPAARPKRQGHRPARVARRLGGLAGARRSLALAAVGLLLLAGTVFAAAPGVRDAVLDFLGLHGATIERRPRLPTPPPERPLDLGTRTTLANAADRLGFAPLVPAELGEADGVYVRPDLPGGELLLTYLARPHLPTARSTRLGALISEFRGDLSPEYVGKVVGPSSSVQRLHVRGRPALWIEGAPHLFFYRHGGRYVDASLRLAQNVLLLERGPLLVRLEGAFKRDRAVAIARSLR